jgi:type III restriction enzyme
MLTRAIELLLAGDEGEPPMSDAAFLWITDQPELNEQTRRKMLQTSSVLLPEDIVVVDASTDEEALEGGKVYFINTQKLGTDKSLVTPGDRRSYTFWETIRNTINANAGRFFLIVDEAHRGMTEDEVGQAEAATIIQKFIKGSSGEIPPVPIVVGVSATPERYNQLISGTGRMHRPVEVDVEDVRESGLIKDKIVIHHPKQNAPADVTLLRESARVAKAFGEAWETYCIEQTEPLVRPLLVVQVRDAHGADALSETDIAEAMRVLREELGPLGSDAWAHSFQEGVSVTIAGETLRYVAPSDINDDPDVMVIFFKTSLNTGWDCPRAEAIMSFRPASDATNIAQLVGRLVRTPLARRVADNELLNSVSLFLPHYNKASLAKVVAKLTRPDDGALPIEVAESTDIVELVRTADSSAAFAALEQLPSYVIPRRRKVSQVRRVMKLARLLTNDGIDHGAIGAAREALLAIMNAEYQTKHRTDQFRRIVERRGRVTVEVVNWEVGTDELTEAASVDLDISSENIDDLFEAAGRKLNEGLHKAWWRERARAEPSRRETIKLELFALCVDGDLLPKLETKAQQLTQAWLSEHRDEISDLPEGSRAAYAEIRNLAGAPELTPLVYPSKISGRSADDLWQKHLFVDEDGLFPAALNRAEGEVVNRLVEDEHIVAWLRNMDRKAWSLCVPYTAGGEARAMYPDFLAVRRDRDRLVVDLIEPHTISLADAPAKAAGLAQFAAQHADRFGKIELILIDQTRSRSFDLTDEATRDRVKAAQVTAQLKQLIDDA